MNITSIIMNIILDHPVLKAVGSPTAILDEILAQDASAQAAAELERERNHSLKNPSSTLTLSVLGSVPCAFACRCRYEHPEAQPSVFVSNCWLSFNFVLTPDFRKHHLPRRITGERDAATYLSTCKMAIGSDQ